MRCPPTRSVTHGFRSRLIIGSGKYASFEQNLACAMASGAEMVTVALRRTNFDAPPGQRLLDVISPERFAILPNTAGCYTAEDAITTARLGRELLGTDLVKLEVIGDERTLFPDVRRHARGRERARRRGLRRCCPTSPTTRSRASGSRRSAAPR